jgi:hypothetical protein
MTRTSLALIAICAVGCYRSHGQRSDAGDSDAGPTDAGPTDAGPTDAGRVDPGASCEFSVRTFDGTDVSCTISSGSREACTEAAVCVCAASGPMTDVDLIRCAGWELTPRGALTFTDFCTLEPPARMTMAEALRGYFGGAPDLRTSEGCDDTPALLGPRPFDGCGFLAEQLCACGAAPCDLDALLGVSCLSLSREQVDCVRERIPGNAPCGADVSAVVGECGG